MKKLLICMIIFTIVFLLWSLSCHAAAADSFYDGIKEIEDSVGKDVSNDLGKIGVNGVDSLIADGVDGKRIWEYLQELIVMNSAGPLSSLLVITAIMLITGVAESYNYSLRYTQTKDVMSVVVSVFTFSVVLSPVTQLITSSVTVINGASAVMTVYLPVMAGIMAFSGSAVASAGYYAAAVTAAQLFSRIASSVLTPVLNLVLMISVSSGICSGVNLSGVTEALGKAFKYIITFAVSIFAAVLGLNATLSASADTVANKAARFGLSSFIPLIGSSISEAYGALQNSMAILKSGVGIFVILAVFITFIPIIIRTILWSAALSIAKTVGEVLNVASVTSVLHSLSQFLSALRAVLIAVMTVFIISSAVMLRIGGHS